MPQLLDLVEKRKFVKKSYRPWDLSGVGTIDGQSDVPQIDPDIQNKVTQIQSNQKNKISQLKQETIAETSTDAESEITSNVTGNKTDNIEATTSDHTGTNEVTQQKQQEYIKATVRQQTDNDTDNITGNATDINYIIEEIKKLTGIQKKIFLYIINVCTARGVLDTGNILSSELAMSANCSIGSAKTSLTRLIDKHLIIRNKGKACRGGFMVLGISKQIQAGAIQAQQLLFNPLRMSNTDNVTGNTLDNNSTYSSSNIYNKTNTTSLPDEWKNIEFEPLKKIGFSETQLRQLFESQSTDPEIVRESIRHFAFGLEYNDKIKTYRDPLNVFMGVLRKGQRWNEIDYVSVKELTLRQILDEKKKKKEHIDAMIKELIDMEFPEWKRSLTSEDVKQIVPYEALNSNLTPAINASLRGHFVETILLPRLKLQGVTVD